MPSCLPKAVLRPFVYRLRDYFVSSMDILSRSGYYTCALKLTAQVKLVVTAEQADALKKTMAEANACCNRLSAWAWENQTFGQYALHKARYAVERAASGLTAQVVVRCNGKVADAYKLDKKTQRVFRPDGAIAYDDRILRWHIERGQVSIWAVGGRLALPFVCGDYQRGLLAFQQGESDLAFHGGEFYLLTTCNLPDPPLIEAEGVLGVDLGIVSLATDSAGRSYSGDAVKACRRRAKRIRALLQSRGTKNARKHLRRIRRRTANYQRHVNHCISKHLVQNALLSRKCLALEDLSGIRERAPAFSRDMKWQMGNWAFSQLGQFVVYKAKMAGLPVTLVDPRNTSRTCRACGHCEKANRKSQSQFLCLHCGFQANADANASANIARKGLEARAAVNGPIDALA
jgi:putative transposase